jgi:hypothetical protein
VLGNKGVLLSNWLKRRTTQEFEVMSTTNRFSPRKQEVQLLERQIWCRSWIRKMHSYSEEKMGNQSELQTEQSEEKIGNQPELHTEEVMENQLEMALLESEEVSED